ncbi:MAG: Polyamine aminopropyltransferase [Hyphomicrobiaceae bacterium hypho_1]
MTRWIEETFNSDWRPAIRADNIMYETNTDHQNMVIFENKFWGKVLILDGVFQLTTRDEFIYHEMMAHVPLITLEQPQKILIIGGGDGGVLREVLKHTSVEIVTLVEIDQDVIDMSIKYYPEVGEKALNDKRTDVIISDGLKFVTKTTTKYDAIIVDSSEPIGPSSVLHSKEFFSICKGALKPDGIFVTQSGVPFQVPSQLYETTKSLSPLYKYVYAYTCTQPCYFGGEFGISFASDNPAYANVTSDLIQERAKQRNLKTNYWNPLLQAKTFLLPEYIKDIVLRAKRNYRLR